MEFFWTRPITASSVTVRSVRHMADTGVMSDNIIKLLVVGELYIGAAECDAGLGWKLSLRRRFIERVTRR